MLKLTPEQKKLRSAIMGRREAKQFNSFGRGLGLATDYVDSWNHTLKGQGGALGLDSESAFEWAIKEAAGRFTWLEDESIPSDGERIDEKFFDDSANLKRFKLPEDAEMPKNALMVFRNKITTNDEDRDGDVLHTEGATIDMPLPLLWQHNSALPIGKMLAVDKHTAKMLRVFSVLLDMNPLTEDTAKLIEAGVLRISHGFIPKVYEPRSEPSKNVPYDGFDIREFEIMEESTVSVPSNRGAVIEMYSRDSFKSGVMQAVGKTLFDNRDDKLWPGFKAPAKKDPPADPPKDPETPAKTVTLVVNEASENEIKSRTVQAESLEKALEQLGIEKAGASISKANKQIIKNAVSEIDEVKEKGGLDKAYVLLLDSATEKLCQLIEDNVDELLPDQPDDEPKAAVVVDKLFVHVPNDMDEKDVEAVRAQVEANFKFDELVISSETPDEYGPADLIREAGAYLMFDATDEQVKQISEVLETRASAIEQNKLDKEFSDLAI